jgi:hypothetical protein
MKIVLINKEAARLFYGSIWFDYVSFDIVECMFKWSFYCEKYPAVVTMENDLLSARPLSFPSLFHWLLLVLIIYSYSLGKICAGGYLSMGRWWWQVIYNLFFSVMYSFISKRKLSFYLSQTHLGYLCISQFLPAPRPHNDEILALELVLDWICPHFCT